MGTLLLIAKADALTELLGEILHRESGYTTVRAETCADALKLLQHTAFQIIVLDLQYYFRADLDFGDQLHTDAQTAAISLVVLTTRPDAPELRPHPMTALIAKPFELDQLIGVVRALVPLVGAVEGCAGANDRS